MVGLIDWQDTEAENAGSEANMWEESWDDDDTSEDFAAQLRQVGITSVRSTGLGWGSGEGLVGV